MAWVTGAGRGRVHLVVICVAAAIAGGLLWQRGFVLTNDSVAVPEQDLLPWMWGAGSAPPRSVPQDSIVAVLDDLVPGALLQRALIVGSILVLGLGVARLLREGSGLEQACAATVAMWSTFVYERMAMGHWGVLLGTACLAWVMDAAADARRGVARAPARVIAWAAVGSLVPSAGALQLAAVVAVVAWPGPRAARQSLLALSGVLVLQLVWVVPGLLHPGSTTPGAADLFGLRPEGGAGALLTGLGTGGIWNSAATPPSRDGVLAVLVPLGLLALAMVGARRVRSLPGTVVGPLAALSLAGLAWAVMTAIPSLSGVVVAVESLPGGGLLRDAQKWLAPWVVLLALAAGAGLARLAALARARDVAVPAMALAVLVPAVLLPDLAFGMGGRLRPATYPADWSQVRSSLVRSPLPGDVVSWPWSAFRSYAWNEGRTLLDPAPRYLPRTVVTDTRLIIAGDEGPTVIASDDPRSRAVGEALLAPDPAPRLRELGIGWVLVQAGQPPAPGYPAELPESLRRASRSALTTPTLELRRISGPVEPPEVGPTWPLGIAWLLWACALLGAGVVGVVGVRHWPRSTTGLAGDGVAGNASLGANERN